MNTPPPPKSNHPDKDNEGKLIAYDGHAAAKRSYNKTATTPAPIDREATYHIAAIGFSNEEDPSAMDGALERAFASVFSASAGARPNGPRIALISGVLTASNWSVRADQARRLAADHHVSVLFEERTSANRAYRACTSTGTLLDVSIEQRIIDSTQANRDRELVDGLLADCQAGGERTINLEGLPIGLLVCGENNLLTNAQSDENRVYVRHHELDGHVFDHVRIVFNGAHTTMGNWGKLNRRFEYLSRDKRWAFYATNCNRNTWGTSTVRVYYDGQRLAHSAAIRDTSERQITIRRVGDPENDVFLALVADIPGHLMV